MIKDLIKIVCDYCLREINGLSFLEKHLDKVDWCWLSGNENIPVEFFEKHLDLVVWEMLSGNPNIPVEFFEKHINFIVWKSLSEGININEQQKKYRESLNTMKIIAELLNQ